MVANAAIVSGKTLPWDNEVRLGKLFLGRLKIINEGKKAKFNRTFFVSDGPFSLKVSKQSFDRLEEHDVPFSLKVSKHSFNRLEEHCFL